jgi:hypothetical protein
MERRRVLQSHGRLDVPPAWLRVGTLVLLVVLILIPGRYDADPVVLELSLPTYEQVWDLNALVGAKPDYPAHSAPRLYPLVENPDRGDGVAVCRVMFWDGESHIPKDAFYVLSSDIPDRALMFEPRRYDKDGTVDEYPVDEKDSDWPGGVDDYYGRAP